MNRLLQVLLGTLVLTVLQFAAGAVAGGHRSGPASAAGWLVVADLATAAVLSMVVWRTPWRGPRLAVSLFLLSLVFPANNLLEAVVFHIVPGMNLWAAALVSAVPLAGFALFAAFAVAGQAPATPPAPATPGPAAHPMRWVLRIALCALLYLLLYYAAGLLVFPFVRDFYADRSLPPVGVVAPLQLVVRGPLFALAVLLVCRMARGTRRQHAVVAALVMSVLGGLAPLIVPNAYLPDPVRFAHLVEVVVSNFIFGWLAGWLLSPARPESAAAFTASAGASA
jgi:hypothetical protein